MPPISAFVAYKNLTKKKGKKKETSNRKIKKFKGNDKVQKRQQISKKSENSQRFVIKDDVYATDEEGLTHEEYIERGLSFTQSDSPAEIPIMNSSIKADDGIKSINSKDSSQKSNSKSKKKANKNKVPPVVKTKSKKKPERKVNGTQMKIQQNLMLNKNTQRKPDLVVEKEPNVVSENTYKTSSITIGENYFRWLINPINLDVFFSNFWESNTLLVKRMKPDFYSTLISFKSIDEMLLSNHVEFTKNLDVTTYENGVRETHNPEGRALPPAVWDFYRDGCSIRLLNPQTFLNTLHELCATLQEYFHCLVGANVYLTPPNSQGFAPHYDDIEAFVLQIEGRKRWKVYSPRSPSEVLPRVSSENFRQEELGEPILDQILEPGDMLYFPRGAIHQACTASGYHSLHITLSVYQKQSYADLFEKIFPIMLNNAIKKNVELRRGLPLNIWHNAGLVYSEQDTPDRSNIQAKVKRTLSQCLKSVHLNDIIDTAVDELAKKFQREALPPFILPIEKPKTIFGLKNVPDNCGDCHPKCPIHIRTNVRLLRANILRLISEEEQLRIYYYLDNSKEYCEYEPNYFEIDCELAGSVEVLIKSYPQYVSVSQLPLADDESKLDLAICLWKRGLLMTEKAFLN